MSDPTPANVRRSLTLAGIGAVAGLALAGIGLFTAKGTSTLAVPPEDVALVNQQAISRVDYIAMLQAMHGTDLAHATVEQKQRVLDDMIREELLVQRGKELDVAGVDPEVRATMVTAVEQGAAMNAFTEQPSDQRLQVYFDSHRAAYASEGEIAVRDLVFTDANMARDAVAALRGGAALEAVIAKFKARDTGKVKGAEFYFAAKIHLGDALYAAAQVLPSGGISDPLEADGMHVLVVTQNTPPTPFAFETVRARVLDDYRRETATKAQAANGDFLRKRANILIAPDSIAKESR